MTERDRNAFGLTKNQKAILMEQLGVLPHELEELFEEEQPQGTPQHPRQPSTEEMQHGREEEHEEEAPE